MTLDPQALRMAEKIFDELLRRQAEEDNAYIFHFPDGRVSIELEWLDLREITRTIVAAYISSADKSDAQSV